MNQNQLTNISSKFDTKTYSRIKLKICTLFDDDNNITNNTYNKGANIEPMDFGINGENEKNNNIKIQNNKINEQTKFDDVRNTNIKNNLNFDAYLYNNTDIQNKPNNIILNDNCINTNKTNGYNHNFKDQYHDQDQIMYNNNEYSTINKQNKKIKKYEENETTANTKNYKPRIKNYFFNQDLEENPLNFNDELANIDENNLNNFHNKNLENIDEINQMKKKINRNDINNEIPKNKHFYYDAQNDQNDHNGEFFNNNYNSNKENINDTNKNRLNQYNNNNNSNHYIMNKFNNSETYKKSNNMDLNKICNNIFKAENNNQNPNPLNHNMLKLNNSNNNKYDNILNNNHKKFINNTNNKTNYSLNNYNKKNKILINSNNQESYDDYEDNRKIIKLTPGITKKDDFISKIHINNINNILEVKNSNETDFDKYFESGQKQNNSNFSNSIRNLLSDRKSSKNNSNDSKKILIGTKIQNSNLPFPLNKILAIKSLNKVQEMLFDELYNTKCKSNPINFVICSPTGSGKTVIFEIAMVELLKRYGYFNNKEESVNNVINAYTMSSALKIRNLKIIYIAPIKSLCSEKVKDWSDRFSPFNLKILELTGDSEYINTEKIKESNIIITTPERWDTISRRWKDYPTIFYNIGLLIVDEIHILNCENRGVKLETVMSRMKFLSQIETFNSGAISNLRIISASATFPNLNDLGIWLDAKVSL